MTGIKKMAILKKYLKIILIGILSIALLNFMLGNWIEYRLQQLLNDTERKSYIITYGGIDLHSFFNGATIESLEIIPMEDSIQDMPVRIFGMAKSVEISGLQWIRLLADRSLDLSSMHFVQPEFRVYFSDDSTRRNETGKSFQELFREVLSGAELRSFNLESGRVSFLKANSSDTVQIAMVDKVDIQAFNIQTDSLLLTYIIPFKLERIQTSFSGIQYEFNEYLSISVDTIQYDSFNESFTAKNASLRLKDEWITVSKKMGIQKDIIEFDIKSLIIRNLKASSTIYDTLKIEATSIEIDSLNLKDYRNKNIPRPEEVIKPLFAGMIRTIPFPLNIDSIKVSNSSISYTELGEQKNQAGTIAFSNVEGTFRGITTYPLQKRNYDKINITVSGDINGDARLNLDLIVPYEGDQFYANAVFTEMDARILNKTIQNFADLAINSGEINAFHLTMDANPVNAKNTLKLDYTNLELALLGENNQSELKRKGFLSTLFNSAIRQNNIPSEHGYKSAEYITARNQERGPFQYIWNSIKEGMVFIIPSNTASLFIQNDKRKQ